MGAWRTLEKPGYDAAWDRFYEKFQFNPSVDPSDWPGILEPADSVTFGIGHVYDHDSNAYDRRTLDLGVKLVALEPLASLRDDPGGGHLRARLAASLLLVRTPWRVFV